MRLNLENPHVTRFVILHDDPLDPASVSGNVITRPHLSRGRASYAEFLSLFGTYNPAGINVVINTDIVLDQTDTPKLQTVKEGEVYCVTRYRVTDDISHRRYAEIPWSSFEYEHSKFTFCITADVWAFRGVYRGQPLPDVTMGIPFCDGLINYHFFDAGYRLWNIAPSFRSYHYHRDATRDHPYSYPKTRCLELRPIALEKIPTADYTRYCRDMRSKLYPG